MRKRTTKSTAASTAKKTAAAVKPVEKVAPVEPDKKTEENAKTAVESASNAPSKAAAPKVKAEAEANAEPKAPVRKTAVKESVYLQFLGKEINKDDLMKQVKEIWTKEQKRKVSDLKSVSLYLKPEENAAYYVINEMVRGKIDL